ncbi:galanin-like peptide [Prionailurus bengalensis]|uniref:galanin-like peptide n=1 Tax=Prionailurus bengalensis TaxID=37029 RepID=UPI001CA93A31|nr:galanin-like peptide [Prionailurus bengalensis]
MAPSVCLVLLLAVLLSLAVTPASAPVHQGRGGWTLNSAGYLLGPELHLLQSRDRGSGKKTALEVPDLWKAIGHRGISRAGSSPVALLVFGADGSVFGPQVSPHIPKYPRAGENDPERVPQNRLPNPHPQQATKRSPRETLAKPETADPGELSKKAPREGEALQS